MLSKIEYYFSKLRIVILIQLIVILLIFGASLLNISIIIKLIFVSFLSLFLVTTMFWYIKKIDIQNKVFKEINKVNKDNNLFILILNQNLRYVFSDRGFYDLCHNVNFKDIAQDFNQSGYALEYQALLRINIFSSQDYENITRFLSSSDSQEFSCHAEPNDFGLDKVSFVRKSELDLIIITGTLSQDRKVSDNFRIDVLDEAQIPALIFKNNKLLSFNSIAQEVIPNIESFEVPEDIAENQVLDIDNYDMSFIVKRTFLSIGEDSYVLVILINKMAKLNDVLYFLERSSVSSAITDKDFNIIFENESFQKTLKNIKRNKQWNFTNILDKSVIDRVQELIDSRRKNSMAGPIEIKLKPDNKIVLLHVNIVYIEENLHFVFTVVDISNYKTLEMNFVHSQKMQAVGQLSGAIAHDFNNLLTAMMGFCDLLLLRHPPGDKSFSELMQIKQNVNRAANLVRQLLAFSRKQVLRPNILEVGNVIADLSNLISRLIGENINLEIEHGKDLDNIKVDQGQLEQVIINLAVNARDAMVDGGTLTISTSNFKIDEDFDEGSLYAPAGDDKILDGDYVLITISDTGIGINHSILDKIFEPFFSTKELGAGTGLGLSTVFGIIKQTEGYIRLKTTERGTSFYIFLKAYKPVEYLEDYKQLKIQETVEQIPVKDLTGRGKILVVEDETSVRMFSYHALTNKGYDVLEVDCAETALKLIDVEGSKIELIITDVMMPGLTGPEMIKEIHKIYPNIKVIFISGYAEDALVDESVDSENFHFLAKPFSLKQLASKVKEVIPGVILK